MYGTPLLIQGLVSYLIHAIDTLTVASGLQRGLAGFGHDRPVGWGWIGDAEEKYQQRWVRTL